MAKKQTLTKISRKGSVPEITPEQKTKSGIVETPKTEKKEKVEILKVKEKIIETPEKKKETPKEEKKPEVKEKKKIEKPKVKKTEAVVNAKNLPISTKYAIEICKFIKYKPLEVAIKDLNLVLSHKRAIPMKGEYAHKKGKKMMSGKYPKKATETFIKLIKSLSSNALVNGVDNPIITEAIANLASRPKAKFGRWQRKRTHVKIVAKEKGSKNKSLSSNINKKSLKKGKKKAGDKK